MKKIFFLVILCLAGASMLSQAKAQSEKFEEIGRKHFENAFYKAIPQKNKALAEKEFALAEKAFKRAIEDKPHRVDAYLLLGRTYHVQKKYMAAARIYRTALKIAPEQKKIYLRLASSLEKAGDYQGAIISLRTLREQETDERTIRILDDFIAKIEQRAARDKQGRN